MIVLQQLKGLSAEKLAAVLLCVSVYLVLASISDIIKRIKRKRGQENDTESDQAES